VIIYTLFLISDIKMNPNDSDADDDPQDWRQAADDWKIEDWSQNRLDQR
jgi:hypothetical protein